MKTTKSKMFLTLTFTALICLSAHAQYAYHITSGSYAYNSDWANAVKLEFGVDATVADWQTIKAEFGGSLSTLNDFMTNSGFVSYGISAWVTVGGAQYYSPSRAYLMERHDGTVPSGSVLI